VTTTKRRALLWGVLSALALSLLTLPATPSPAVVRTTGTQTIYLEGDSITAGSELPFVTDHLDRRLAVGLGIDPARIHNDGISGQSLTLTHPNLVDRWPALLAPMQAGDVLYLDIGMNDVMGAYPGDVVFTNAYFSIVIAAINKGIHVVIGEITNVMPALWRGEISRERLNNWFSGEFGANAVVHYGPVLHCVTGSCAPSEWIQPRKAMDDGEHPDEGGTAEMADLLTAQILNSGWWNG
jgi:lysophospholipase L1-like esterase